MEEYDDPEQRLENTYRDLERVGFAEHPLLMNAKINKIIGDGGQCYGKLQEKLFKINASDEEKFAHILQAVFYKYQDDLRLSRNELFEILEVVSVIPNIYYKNPTCFLFGYYIVENKEDEAKINNTRLKNVKELIKGDYEFNDVDIIRYCRLWINHYENEE